MRDMCHAFTLSLTRFSPPSNAETLQKSISRGVRVLDYVQSSSQP